jgi:hypothetical protein
MNTFGHYSIYLLQHCFAMTITEYFHPQKTIYKRELGARQTASQSRGCLALTPNSLRASFLPVVSKGAIEIVFFIQQGLDIVWCALSSC